jgi:hypothetical protein
MNTRRGERRYLLINDVIINKIQVIERCIQRVREEYAGKIGYIFRDDR